MNTRFAGGHATFAAYIAATQAMLARVHRGADAAQRCAGNAPFELAPPRRDGRSKPYRRGIVLCHGLTDSPYHMRHLAEFFRAQGFRVLVPLLPGHGTRPGDLLDVRRQEWARALAFGAACLAQEADELYLGGLSIGGALSLRHSLLDPRVRGLFLFAPALRISRIARLARLRALCGALYPPARWLALLPDRDCYKYETLAAHAVAETHALIAKLQAMLQQRLPAVPLFAAASLDDITVDCRATLDLVARAPHPASRLVLYTTEPAAFAHTPRVEAVDSALPQQRILGAGHTAIVVAPEDAHYGAAGSYANCLHYYRSDPARYAACCADPQNAWQGEPTRGNLGVGLLRRPTYNPHFAALQESMQRFIATLPEPRA